VSFEQACEGSTSRVNLAAIAKSAGPSAPFATPFNEFANYLMSKTTSDLSSHTPMMQQYGLEQFIGHVPRGFRSAAV
jgi:DNA mismatch repair protein MutS